MISANSANNVITKTLRIYAHASDAIAIRYRKLFCGDGVRSARLKRVLLERTHVSLLCDKGEQILKLTLVKNRRCSTADINGFHVKAKLLYKVKICLNIKLKSLYILRNKRKKSL